MKKYGVLILLLTILWTTSFAQRFAYVNTEYILNQIPEFDEAQQKIDKVSEEWRSEIDKKHRSMLIK